MARIPSYLFPSLAGSGTFKFHSDSKHLLRLNLLILRHTSSQPLVCPCSLPVIKLGSGLSQPATLEWSPFLALKFCVPPSQPHLSLGTRTWKAKGSSVSSCSGFLVPSPHPCTLAQLTVTFAKLGESEVSGRYLTTSTVPVQAVLGCGS